MHLSTGPSSNTWNPVTTADDTTDASYWLNWRFLVCLTWVLSSMTVASVLLWKCEGSGREKGGDGVAGTRRPRTPGSLYEDELWRPCLKGIHPVWLLCFRLTAFVMLLALLILNVLVDGGGIFYYYTQWTFTLVTFYFAIGVTLSIYGCYQYLNKISGEDLIRSDTELGSTYEIHATGDAANVNGSMKNSHFHEEQCTREIAGFWGYLFQIVYQTTAGAVILTDCVFWLIIVPFLSIKDYDLNSILIGMHSVNAIFLLGETALNSMHFPWFRIAYFLLWTSSYVIFEWLVHASRSIWWPYPFLDLSSSFAPLWYFLVAVMHVPCYAVFPLVIQMKSFVLSKWFPESMWRSA